MTSATPRREAIWTFADDILFQAQMRPEQPAIVLAGRLATYSMIARGIAGVEARLRSLGFQPGELVAVALASPVSQIIVVAALFRLGVASVSVERGERLRAAGLAARACLQDPGGALVPGVTPILVDKSWFEGSAPAAGAAGGFTDNEALCRVELSSGSTGRPKAIASTVGDFERRLGAQRVVETFGVRGRVLIALQLSSGWGFRVAVGVLAGGGTLIFAATTAEVTPLAAAAQAEAIVTSPIQARDLLRDSKPGTLGGLSLRALLIGGGLATRALVTEVRSRLCANTIVQYGATESGPITITPADLLMETEGATGRPLPGVTIEIVDNEDRPVRGGAAGNVRVRTAAMGRIFSPRDDGADAQLRDGWFYPGDIGRLREDGMLVLEGRASEVINSGGVKHAPERIEEVVLRHPNVADAGAFGAFGPDGIEEINVAVVVRAPISEALLIDWCREHGVHVARAFTVDSLPRTPLGKIRRGELKDSLVG